MVDLYVTCLFKYRFPFKVGKLYWKQHSVLKNPYSASFYKSFNIRHKNLHKQISNNASIQRNANILSPETCLVSHQVNHFYWTRNIDHEPNNTKNKTKKKVKNHNANLRKERKQEECVSAKSESNAFPTRILFWPNIKPKLATVSILFSCICYKQFA